MSLSRSWFCTIRLTAAVAALLALPSGRAFIVTFNSFIAPGVAQPDRLRIGEAFGHLPLSFVVNEGQNDESVNFSSRGPGYSLFLKPQEAVFVISKNTKRRPVEAERATERLSAVAMKLLGSNPTPKVAGVDELPGKANYFIGNDPAKWRTSVSTYERVKYAGVYPGIDLMYYGHDGQLEYDFIVSPGSNTDSIRLNFGDSRHLSIEKDGSLILKTNSDDIRLLKPIIYQQVAGHRREVAGQYALLNENEVRFKVGPYDPRQPLVIDPTVVYSTVLSGSNTDSGFGIAVDSSGNAYVAGQTYSSDFPTVNPFQGTYGQGSDAFVAKLSATGSLIYSTYFGGASYEDARAIAVDATGNAYVTGMTISVNFPTKNPFQANLGDTPGGDAFVTKFNASGNALIYSTYLGGTASDRGYGIAVDNAGNAFVTGVTSSSNFPVVAAFQPTLAGGGNAFVTKLNAAGSALIFSTYLGGGGEQGNGITTDASGNAYVVGTTSSNNFPTVNPFQATMGGWGHGILTGYTYIDAFLTKFNPSGSVFYSTFLGGHSQDDGSGVAVDSAGDAYVVGDTTSPDFPLMNALQPTVSSTYTPFVTKFNASGSALLYSTYWGTGIAPGVAVDAAGDAYVTGNGGSVPLVNAIQACPGSFISKFDPSGSSLIYSTCGVGGKAIAVDGAGNAYVTGGSSTQHVLISKVADTGSTGPTLSSISPSFGAQGSTVIVTLTGLNFVSGSTTVSVSGSGVTVGAPSGTTTQLTATFTTAASAATGVRSVTVTTPGGTSGAVTFTVTPPPPQLNVSPSTLSISGQQGGVSPNPQTLALTTSDGSAIGWSTAVSTSAGGNWLNASPASGTTPGSVSVSMNPAGLSAGTYNGTVSVTAASAANSPQTVAVTLTVTGANPVPVVSTLSPGSAAAGGSGFTLTVNGSNFTSGALVQWNGANRTTTYINVTQLQATIPSSDIAASGTGQVTVVNPAPGGGQSNALSFTISAGNNPIPALGSLEPNTTASGSSAFTLALNGSNFIPNSVVQWNGSNRTTTFVSATQIQAAIPASDVATSGTAQITAVNPAPGGGQSNALSFTISSGNNPIPALASLAPNTIVSGSSAFTFTLNGSNFISNSVVNWNGSSRPTTFVNASQLQAAISASDVSSPGTVQVMVSNPTPGGGQSNALTFSITAGNPAPLLTTITPSAITAGSAGFVLTLNGANFVNSSVVQWNGSSRNTAYVSATQLQASISSQDIAIAGTAAVSVTNPAGKSSNTIDFTILPPGASAGISFSIPNFGTLSMLSGSSTGSLSAGYGVLQPGTGSSAPFGAVVFGLRSNGILVSETSVPSTPAITSGRVYAEVDGAINTGIAMANPTNEDATISFYFTDANGRDFGSGTTILPAGQQIAKFLSESPFNSGSPMLGTFSFSSSVTIAVIALRGVTNERNEFLMSTLPVVPAVPLTDPVVLPQFADGAGYTTSVVLVNPTDSSISGTIQFFDPGSTGAPGQPQTITLGGLTGTAFSYSIPARSSQKLTTSGAGASIHAGSIHITPFPGQPAPTGLAIYELRLNGIAVSETGVSLTHGPALDVYAENSSADSVQSGVAISNNAAVPITVNVQAIAADGSYVGSTTISIPAQGQIAKLLTELAPAVSPSYMGMLRVTASSDISVVGLRLRNNERGDTLITATPALSENMPVPSAPVFFPHFVKGGGFTTQVLLLGTGNGQETGTLRLFASSGSPADLN